MLVREKRHRYGKWNRLRIGGIVLGTAVLTAACAYRKQEATDYQGLASHLQDAEECYLCGNSNRSLMGYYRKMSAVGMISLNDWYICDFRLNQYDGEEGQEGGSSFGSGNSSSAGGISYSFSSMPSKGEADVTVTLPEDARPDKAFLQKNLCQACLDKVCDSLENGKGESREAVPLCLVDFKTLEVYPVQEEQKEYVIRNYQVEISLERS